MFGFLMSAGAVAKAKAELEKKLKAGAEPAEAVAPSATPTLPQQLAVEPFIDKHEVAFRLGRTTRTVDSLMRRGFIPYYKVGYRVQFRWSEIQSHFAQTCRICRRTGGAK